MIISPFFRLGAYPELFLKGRTYKDLGLFYMTMIPAYFLTLFRMTIYFLLPIRTSVKSHDEMYNYFLKKVEERGIKFKVEAKVEYPHYY
jgi:hypothetical protein